MGTDGEKVFVFSFLFFALFFLSSNYAFAARPLTTDDAWTVEKGKFQLEAGFDGVRQDNHDREYRPSVTLTYGLLNRMDAAVGTGYLFFHPKEGKNKDGWTDTEIKTKFRFLDEKSWRPAFAVAGKLKIPTASRAKGLGSGKVDFGLNAISSKNLSRRWAVHLNLGYTWIAESEATDEFNYSLAAQFVLSDKWALVGEVVGVNNLNGHGGDDPLSGLIGAYFLVKDNLVLDAGVELGMNKAAPDFRITAGLTFLFGF